GRETGPEHGISAREDSRLRPAFFPIGRRRECRPSWSGPWIGMVEHRLGLSLAKLLERVAIFGVFVRQDRGGQQRGVHGSRFSDREGSDWNAGRHLRDGEQR